MRAKDIALIGLLSATLTAGKLALAFVPNVEIVTLLFIIYSIVFGIKRTLLVSIIFTTTEIMIYGFNTWLLVYYIIWPALVIISGIIGKKVKTEYGFAFLAGIYGLSFGLFFAVSESFFYGIGYGITYWVKGLPFDILHGFSNFILVLILFKPLKNTLDRQVEKYI
ncbi:hypothetical protein GOQ27_11235 [Clostridium sp. D2Q-11]|uniref:Energy-coupling factor transport system substrate-specific component n=1 Tax=Anaeromonas frigoriresistens TaxID=2683708 RepID=A0A942UUX0_9FIRM|nr:hypothetical protein [Anaeromonas frigoriresistens]MBS4539038.1 hypothetical protein [Anaeromonas frigoriresistens]